MSLPALARTLPAATAPREGKWILYSGDEMRPHLTGLPVAEGVTPRLVVDLATCTVPASIPALHDHSTYCVLGRFSPVVMPEGILAGLDLTLPTTEAEAEALRIQVEMAAHIRNQVPLQCSAGFEAGPQGRWERIPDGQAVTVNGRTFTGGPDTDPLFVLYGGTVFEASLLLFGADGDTGRAAASRPRHPSVPLGTAMSITPARLKALCSKHDAKHHAHILALCADGMTDEQIATKLEADAKAELETRCSAAEAEVETLKAQIAELQAKLDAMTPPTADATAKATATSVKPVPHGTAGPQAKATAEPKTISDGIRAVQAENPKITANAARAEARRRWPNLQPG